MRWRFFGGKGGVGKTTCAAACAVARADLGAHVLAVSTDPAHSLGDALGAKLSAKPRAAGKVWAAELDADRALERWLEERRPILATIAERGTMLDREDVERFLRLSFPGVDELIGLIELTRLAKLRAWDEVVVDTAPTGHTLRLLEMPETLRRIAGVFDDMQAKHHVLEHALARRIRRDTADALVEEIDAEGRDLADALRDPERTSFHWVMLPEKLSFTESEDGLRTLRAAKIPIAEIAVNRVTAPPDQPCDLCDGRRRAERFAIRDARKLAGETPLRFLPALDEEPCGARGLRRVARALAREDRGEDLLEEKACKVREAARKLPLRPFPLRVPDEVRLVLVGGKGGAGKTTVASAIALLEAERTRKKILLLSADPAHSLGDALGTKLSGDEREIAPRLFAREIDAPAELARRRDEYREAVDRFFDSLRGGSRFDAAYDRAIVRDLIDLAPPGIDELFAVTSVIDARARFDLVVVDTAPTGHALRLLRMPAAAREWVKALLAVLLKYKDVFPPGKVHADLVALSKGLRELEATLADRRTCAFLPVTRAAVLPVAETGRLLASLDELGMEVPAIVVNAVTPPGCARCRRAAAGERAHIALLARRKRVIFTADAIAPPPVGADAIRDWAKSHWQAPSGMR